VLITTVKSFIIHASNRPMGHHKHQLMEMLGAIMSLFIHFVYGLGPVLQNIMENGKCLSIDRHFTLLGQTH
jgi:hypothetical protein